MARFKSFVERELRKYGLWNEEQRVGEEIELDGNTLTFSQLYTIYKDYNKWAYSVNMPGTWVSFMTKLIPYINYTPLKKHKKTISSLVKDISKKYNKTLSSVRIKSIIEHIQTNHNFAHSNKTWALAIVYHLGYPNITQRQLCQDFGISEVTLRRALKKIAGVYDFKKYMEKF